MGDSTEKREAVIPDRVCPREGVLLWLLLLRVFACVCVCISQLLAVSFCASAAMFFFYVSFWLAELASDWLIVQGG